MQLLLRSVAYAAAAAADVAAAADAKNCPRARDHARAWLMVVQVVMWQVAVREEVGVELSHMDEYCVVVGMCCD